MITLYCHEAPGLKLGPGIAIHTPPAPDDANAGRVVRGHIEFVRGFATFEPADFPAWREWVEHPGTPPIEIVDDGSGFVPDGTPGAHVCGVCGRSFAAKIALTGHLRSHAPKDPTS